MSTAGWLIVWQAGFRPPRPRRPGRRAARADRGKLIAGDGRGQLHILLDDVNAARGDALGKEPARRPLARLGLADQPSAAGQPRHHRRADRSLQVDDGVVLAGPERRAQSLDFMEGLAAEGALRQSLVAAKCRWSTSWLR